ncbi:hypothetical protein KY362_07660, partial [Candidatus Woesearchaeota archaeon]|nr:hypothetical protein [Candidatus Woesearchaeota archaeon]
MKKKNEKTVPEKKKSKKKQDVLHQDFTSDSQPALSEEETEDLIQEVIAERRKKGLTEFTTVKKRLNGTVVYIDIPSHIKEWNRKMYGYQLSMQTGVILIRIIPRIKYQKHLLSHEELEKRLLLVRKKYLSMG